MPGTGRGPLGRPRSKLPCPEARSRLSPSSAASSTAATSGARHRTWLFPPCSGGGRFGAGLGRTTIAGSMRAVCQRVSEARVRVAANGSGGDRSRALHPARRGPAATPLRMRSGSPRRSPASGSSPTTRPLRPEPRRRRRLGARRLPVHAARRHREGKPAELHRRGTAGGGGAALRALLRCTAGARRPGRRRGVFGASDGGRSS